MQLDYRLLKYALIAILFGIMAALNCSAQHKNSNNNSNIESGNSDVWGAANKTIKGLKEKGVKKIGAVRKWKDHLKQWGLDSNYNYSLALSGRLNSDGYGGSIIYKRKGAEKHTSNYSVYQLRFSEVKHEKEVAQQRDNTAFPQLGPGTPYAFGKVANCYTLQLGYGREKLLLPGILEGNVSIGFRYGGGFSLAMLKPYYLELLQVDYSTTPATAIKHEEGYSDANSSLFLNPSAILGKGRWKKGLNEMIYVPGVFGEAAIVIEPAKGKSAFIQTITLGISGAFYSKNLVIMAAQKAYPFEGCLFAALELGKR